MTRDEEVQRVQPLLNAAQIVANDLSMAGEHGAAANVMGVVQLARALWVRLAPTAPEPEAT